MVRIDMSSGQKRVKVWGMTNCQLLPCKTNVLLGRQDIHSVPLQSRSNTMHHINPFFAAITDESNHLFYKQSRENQKVYLSDSVYS